MEDRIERNGNRLEIYESAPMRRMKQSLFWVMLVFTCVVSGVVLTKVTSGLKYGIVLMLAVVLLFYKLVYLRQAGDWREPRLIFSMTEDAFFWTNEEIRYTVPISAVKSVEDRAFYWHKAGEHSSGWNHSFAFLLKENRYVNKFSVDNERLPLERDEQTEVEVYHLNLNHQDYEMVVSALQERVKQNNQTGM